MEPAKTKDGKPLGQQDVWVINADGTNRQRLTDGRGINAGPSWSADDRVYFVSDRGGTESIWSASAKSVSSPTMNATGNHGDPAHSSPPADALASPDSGELQQ
jgi:Tol biopolymer transport system component